MVLCYTSSFNSIVYNLNGLVVIALASKSDAQSSSHTRILKKDIVCLGLAHSSLIHVFINPEPPPPPSQLLLVEISSPINRRWGVQSVSRVVCE
jgi:hypothetical protein